MQMTNLLVGLKHQSERERETMYDSINNVLTSEAGQGIKLCNNLVYLLLPNIDVQLLTNNNYTTSSTSNNKQSPSATKQQTSTQTIKSFLIK